MVEQEVEMSSTGELDFKIPQQEWTGNDVIQSSHFAGQEIFIKSSDEQSDEFELHYLGLKVSGFDQSRETGQSGEEDVRLECVFPGGTHETMRSV